MDGIYATDKVRYPEVFYLVDIENYRMRFDLLNPNDWLRYEAELTLKAAHDGVKMIPFYLNEGLSELSDERRNKGVKLLQATLADGTPLEVLHQEWEKGATIVLPEPLAKGARTTLVLKLEGHDTFENTDTPFHYPRSTTTWYPRHGSFDRASYDMTFRHPKKFRVISVGERLREDPDPEDKNVMVTQWRTTTPVAFIAFGVGRFKRHEQQVEIGGTKIPIEFYSGESVQIKEDFLLAEMSNAVRFFSSQFGDYDYGRLGAAYFPQRYGQGFPTMLLLPAKGHADRDEFAFIAHEVAHQWWGNMVGWRTYRDQWLSEGFAEYSGMLYTAFRQEPKKAAELIRRGRRDLLQSPKTDTGILEGTVNDIGPLILGLRLRTRRSLGAYNTLIYQKGALVLRMLHFLFTDPQTGDAQLFFDMMREFVRRHRNTAATTENFVRVASAHFRHTKLAQRFGMKDLRWFFRQWVFETALPEYELQYSVTKSKGKAMLRGTLHQRDTPEHWLMPLLLEVDFGGGRMARDIVIASGPKREFEFSLPSVPKKVTLDPDHWVLSRETSTKKVKR